MPSAHFTEVPEHWKAPIGPYHQAPEEYGGEWWLVNPFTTRQPWLNGQNVGKVTTLPEGFEGVFGGPPKFADFAKFSNPQFLFRQARDKYQQDLRWFKRAGEPEFLTSGELANIAATFAAWELGSPRYYEGRYGWMARFPDSGIRDFEIPAWVALNGAHQAIAGYQMRLIERGIIPETRHPFVPPHVWPQTNGDEAKREIAAIQSEINSQLAPKALRGARAATKKTGGRRKLSKPIAK